MITRKTIFLFMLQKPDPLATLYNAGIHGTGRWLVRGISLSILPLIPLVRASLSTAFIRQDAQANPRMESGNE
jgi:hypothetical protein